MNTHGEVINQSIQPYYPYVTRSLLRLYEAGALTNVSGVIVEPEYGYVSQIQYTNSTYRITYGNDLGLNTGTAGDLARDKGHSKFILAAAGVAHPAGDQFLLPWWADKIGPTQQRLGHQALKTTDQAASFIASNMGYPAYIKPNDGSKGSGVYKIHDDSELQTVLEEYEEKKVRVAIVEEPIALPDYRVVLLDGELISAYERIPLAVTGNGKKSVEQLILSLQETFIAQDRDTRLDPNATHITRYLKNHGIRLSDIVADGQTITLAAISNLSAGGTSRDVTGDIHERWVSLCKSVATHFNLRLCGVDLACGDIADKESAYSVLEVNAAPGLDHYAQSGEVQKLVVDKLYARVFNAMPDTPISATALTQPS